MKGFGAHQSWQTRFRHGRGLVLLLFTQAAQAQFVPGNCWHIPANPEPPGVTMRNPAAPTTAQAVYIYNGNYHPAAEQTGGWLFWRKSGQSAWTSNALTFDALSGDNRYWVSTIPADQYLAGDIIEYVLQVSYSNEPAVDATFLGTTNGGSSSPYATFAEASARPFIFTLASASTNLGPCWHHPAAAEPPGAHMRNPVEPYAHQSVYFYNGNVFQGAPPTGNQSGGALFYRSAGSGGWLSSNLSFDTESGDLKYWKTFLPGGTFDPGAAVEYYLEVTYTDRDPTYLGTVGSHTSRVFATAAEAQASPFLLNYGTDPGESADYIWHAGKVARLGDASARFLVKIGYADGDGSNRWVDSVVMYYTTNGASPEITGNGTVGEDTFMLPLSFSHMEPDGSPAGDAMWWSGVLGDGPDAPVGTIRYRIGAWNSAYGHAQRFADLRTPDGERDFEYALTTPGAEALQVSIDGGASWINADYTTSKAFIDEIAGETVEVRVRCRPEGAGVANVEVFSNLGRRDFVHADYTNAWITGDGYPDGIFPPDGNLLTTNDTGAYFRAFPMIYNAGSGYYEWSTNVAKCGAYRLTARHQTAAQSGTNWTWYSTGGRRDHAVVISPSKAHQLTMYELNPLTIKATDATREGRSTFADLLAGNPDSFTNFNLNYLDKLQVNTLWFMPIHPAAETDRGTLGGDEPGSPYAKRDYFAVAKWFGRDETEAGAMQEFTNFVAACDAHTGSVGSIHVMLDAVLNHTAWDAVMGQGGVKLGWTGDPDASMPGTRPGWYSSDSDYGEPATFYTDVWTNDIALAPDRGDFGKWLDVADLFFGRYSALVRRNPEDNNAYLNEDDEYDYAGMTDDTKDLWRYFAEYATFWLDRSGHPLTNTWVRDTDNLGIDGFRCDFGQALPPQFWEYVINHTRTMKWNFIFMVEAIDTGKPGYRSNRHFDVLNDDLMLMFHDLTDADTIRNALELRQHTFNGGTVLLNQTSHDETMPSQDPWRTASFYGAVSTASGIPMLFSGQEWGIRPASGETGTYNQGYARFELNTGKLIPHFKRWNRATFWEAPHPDDSEGLPEWFSRVNRARLQSPALQSVHGWFLRSAGGASHRRILSVAKVELPEAGPESNEVVLAFALILPETPGPEAFTYDLQPCWQELGLDTGTYYNVRNLASSDPEALLWPVPRHGQELHDLGIGISFTAGTGESNAITDDGALVQYLRVVPVEVTRLSPVPVPHAWLDGWFPGPHTDPEYEALALQTASNGTMPVWETYVANIDPTDPAATFKVEDVLSEAGDMEWHIAFTAQPGRTYAVHFTDDGLDFPSVAWTPFGNPARGIFTNSDTGATAHTFVDDFSGDTTGHAPVGGRRFYRLMVEPVSSGL